MDASSRLRRLAERLRTGFPAFQDEDRLLGAWVLDAIATAIEAGDQKGETIPWEQAPAGEGEGQPSLPLIWVSVRFAAESFARAADNPLRVSAGWSGQDLSLIASTMAMAVDMLDIRMKALRDEADG